MKLHLFKGYKWKCLFLSLIISIITFSLPVKTFSQTNPPLDIYKMVNPDSPLPDSLFLLDIIKYIQDTLFFGGAKLSDPKYIGNTKGVGLFRDGLDIGFSDGMIISNGWVGTTITIDGGTNKTGAQGIPGLDSLGPYNAEPNGPPVLRDSDMDWIAGMFTPNDPKPDTAVDPSYIIFKFKPYYSSIKLDYAFASEEYKYQQPPLPPPPPPPIDVDLTGEDVSDFMAIMIKKYPSEQNYDMIASMIGQDGDPSWMPVCVKTLNHTTPPGYYAPNYDKSFIFDGASTPRPIFPFVTEGSDVVPCQTYWIKVAVADYPNGIVMQGYNLSHQINSAVFLKAYSLMSDYGLEWTVESAITNNDFLADSALVEGGCSDLSITVKFNVMPRDTTFLRMRIDNAIPSEYTITPPLFQDSLIVIPDSVMEYTMIVSAIDDNINEGTGGKEPWHIRYTLDPCDVPSNDGGIGEATAGYSGHFKVYTLDYNPYVNTSKTYGPNPPNIYHCGNNITVDIADILEGGIPPYTYSWANPPQIGNQPTFNTTIGDSPDQAICTIFDRCTGKPGYTAGKDTVYLLSTLVCQASPDFQLCQNGESDIKVQCPYVGHNYTTVWYFNGNPVGNDSIYTVTWDDYGQYAPNTITFTAVVTDDCGNTAQDIVQATFFPVVEIAGAPLVCLGFPIQLTCTSAQSYEWHEGSLAGPVLGNGQILNYIAPPPGNANHTICVTIINDCGEQADTCYTFYVSEMIEDMKMNNSTNFNTCPNVPFTLEEMNAYGGWEWKWFDDGTNHTATGKVIDVTLKDAGPCDVTVIAYNINGCYDTITRTVNVYPYAYPQTSTSLPSVCIGYPATIGIQPTGPVTIENYYWTASPPDPSLAAQVNLPSPTVFPHVTTTYQCRITDNHGCLDSATVTVIARPRIDVQIFADPDSSCTDKPVQVNFNTIVAPQPGATYSWTFDDGVPATSNQAAPPQVIWSNPGLKTITCYIAESGCDSTFTFYFQVNPDPLAAFTASNSFGCQPVQATFNNHSSNLENPSYLWDFGDGSTETVENPSHIYPDAGIYDVTLTVTNSTGCINTFTLNDAVEVYEVPVADFSADPQAATIDNPTIKFSELVNIPFALIKWDFGDSTNISTEDNPRHTYGAPGSYMVVMYTETEHGCWDRDTLEIGIVEDIKIFVPNAFSPNGDGLNECFSIGGTTGDIVDVFKVMIFNRWGVEVWESSISDPTCIWDGKDKNGVKVPGDTYIFRIFGQNIRGAKKVYEGMVTVVL
jgi:gliding motility-associated-like protein